MRNNGAKKTQSATPAVLRLGRNDRGRDLLVGDIHGCVSKLMESLRIVGFDPTRDRVFVVGDLVDRGPQSMEALELLDKPWFFSVRGNHEDALLAVVDGLLDKNTLLEQPSQGAEWFFDRSAAQRKKAVALMRRMPIAIELETANGRIGVVHAECPLSSWDDMVQKLEAGDEHVRGAAMWSRKRIKSGCQDPVEGVRAVVVGHTPVQHCASLGNTLYIDTGAWAYSEEPWVVFGVIEANTLQHAWPTHARQRAA